MADPNKKERQEEKEKWWRRPLKIIVDPKTIQQARELQALEEEEGCGLAALGYQLPDSYENWVCQLSLHQRQVVYRSWKNFGVSGVNAGMQIYMDLFEEQPDLKKQFGLEDRSNDKLASDPELLKQSTTLGRTLEFLITRVTNETTLGQVIIPFLRDLGARHFAFRKRGFRGKHLDLFAHSMTDCLIRWDGGEIKGKGKDKWPAKQAQRDKIRAWRIFIHLVLSEMRAGYDRAEAESKGRIIKPTTAEERDEGGVFVTGNVTVVMPKFPKGGLIDEAKLEKQRKAEAREAAEAAAAAEADGVKTVQFEDDKSKSKDQQAKDGSTATAATSAVTTSTESHVHATAAQTHHEKSHPHIQHTTHAHKHHLHSDPMRRHHELEEMAKGVDEFMLLVDVADGKLDRKHNVALHDAHSTPTTTTTVAASHTTPSATTTVAGSTHRNPPGPAPSSAIAAKREQLRAMQDFDLNQYPNDYMSTGESSSAGAADGEYDAMSGDMRQKRRQRSRSKKAQRHHTLTVNTALANSGITTLPDYTHWSRLQDRRSRHSMAAGRSLSSNPQHYDYKAHRYPSSYHHFRSDMLPFGGMMGQSELTSSENDSYGSAPMMIHRSRTLPFGMYGSGTSSLTSQQTPSEQSTMESYDSSLAFDFRGGHPMSTMPRRPPPPPSMPHRYSRKPKDGGTALVAAVDLGLTLMHNPEHRRWRSAPRAPRWSQQEAPRQPQYNNSRLLMVEQPSANNDPTYYTGSTEADRIASLMQRSASVGDGLHLDPVYAERRRNLFGVAFEQEDAFYAMKQQPSKPQTQPQTGYNINDYYSARSTDRMSTLV